VLIEDSTFSDNEVVLDKKPEANGGGIMFGPTRATVSGSTFARNKAIGGQTKSQGGGLFWSGPGNEPGGKPPSLLSITNSTFASNTADVGGGQWTGTWYPPAVTVDSCTFVANAATSEAGAAYEDKGYGLLIRSSLFSLNTAPESPHSNSTTEAGSGNNLEHPATGATLGNASIQADPMLTQLAANGGPTWTFSLAAGSPAVDAALTSSAPRGINAANCGTLSRTSARSSGRPLR
jgi:hypothetical protein